MGWHVAVEPPWSDRLIVKVTEPPLVAPVKELDGSVVHALQQAAVTAAVQTTRP
jgi:hypothetical protein